MRTSFSIYTEHLHTLPDFFEPPSISTRLYLGCHGRRILGMADQNTGHAVSWVPLTSTVLKCLSHSPDSYVAVQIRCPPGTSSPSGFSVAQPVCKCVKQFRRWHMFIVRELEESVVEEVGNPSTHFLPLAWGKPVTRKKRRGPS